MTRRPVWSAVGGELAAAQRALRDRLFGAAKRRMTAQALAAHDAMRQAERYEPHLWSNLVGVGVGEKVTDGARTGELCVKVLVAKKFPPHEVPASEMVPPEIDGVPTDVEEVGYARAFAPGPRDRQRPVVAGVSCGLDLSVLPQPNAGTLGLVVADGTRRFALSNNHVLANENEAPEGAPIVQPGTIDAGRAADRVATLTRFVPLRFGNQRNLVDGAIAAFDGGVAVEADILGIGRPSGTATARLGAAVRKSGRTTGVTDGVVRAVRFDARSIRYEHGLARMDDVVVVEGTRGAFSAPGDSGSAVLNDAGRVVALLFGGSPQVTFVIPIARVLRALGVKVAS